MEVLKKIVLAIVFDIMVWALWEAYFLEKATELGDLYLVPLAIFFLVPWIAVAKSLKG